MPATSPTTERVLITGAGGLLGCALTTAYVARGAQVHTAQRTPFDGQPSGAGHHALDVTSRDEVAALIGHLRPTLIVHLAGLLAADDPASMRAVNVGGTSNVLAAAAAQTSPPAVITASSERAYGSSGGHPLTEDHALDGQGLYGATKAEADRLTRAAAQGGLRATVLRLSNTYGPHDPVSTRIVPCIAQSLVTGEPLQLRTSSSAKRDFLHIDDAVAAYLAVGGRLIDDPGAVSGRAFNVGTGVGTSVGALAALAAATIGAELVTQPPAADPQDVTDDRVLDTALIRRTVGWAPLVPLEDGLAETVAAARAVLVPASRS